MFTLIEYVECAIYLLTYMDEYTILYNFKSLRTIYGPSLNPCKPLDLGLTLAPNAVLSADFAKVGYV